MRRALALVLCASAPLIGGADDAGTPADTSSTTGSGGGGSGGGASTSTGSGGGGAAPFDPDAPVHLATDVTIERIWALRSVAVPLADEGAPLASDVPIVAGRELTLRVFLTKAAAPKPVEIQVVLEPEGGAPSVISVPWSAGAAGVDGAIETTPRVVIPEALVQPGLRYAGGGGATSVRPGAEWARRRRASRGADAGRRPGAPRSRGPACSRPPS